MKLGAHGLLSARLFIAQTKLGHLTAVSNAMASWRWHLGRWKSLRNSEIWNSCFSTVSSSFHTHSQNVIKFVFNQCDLFPSFSIYVYGTTRNRLTRSQHTTLYLVMSADCDRQSPLSDNDLTQQHQYLFHQTNRKTKIPFVAFHDTPAGDLMCVTWTHTCTLSASSYRFAVISAAQRKMTSYIYGGNSCTHISRNAFSKQMKYLFWLFMWKRCHSDRHHYEQTKPIKNNIMAKNIIGTQELCVNVNMPVVDFFLLNFEWHIRRWRAWSDVSFVTQRQKEIRRQSG